MSGKHKHTKHHHHHHHSSSSSASSGSSSSSADERKVRTSKVIEPERKKRKTAPASKKVSCGFVYRLCVCLQIFVTLSYMLVHRRH